MRSFKYLFIVFEGQGRLCQASVKVKAMMKMKMKRCLMRQLDDARSTGVLLRCCNSWFT